MKSMNGLSEKEFKYYEEKSRKVLSKTKNGVNLKMKHDDFSSERDFLEISTALAMYYVFITERLKLTPQEINELMEKEIKERELEALSKMEG